MAIARGRTLIVVAGLAWLACVMAGMGGLWAYANTPAESASAPATWPAESRLSRVPGRPTLVVLLHPQCSCSVASVSELNRLMAHVNGRVTVHAVFYVPAHPPSGSQVADLWRDAAAIPGVEVSRDDGVEIEAFGAAASGQVLLYDAAGALAFNGGITFARGHAGDSDGRRGLESLILEGRSDSNRTPVFGCALRGQDE